MVCICIWCSYLFCVWYALTMNVPNVYLISSIRILLTYVRNKVWRVKKVMADLFENHKETENWNFYFVIKKNTNHIQAYRPAGRYANAMQDKIIMIPFPTCIYYHYYDVDSVHVNRRFKHFWLPLNGRQLPVFCECAKCTEIITESGWTA